MGGTYVLTMDDRGRVVVPSDLRQSRNWSEGITLVAVDAERGGDTVWAQLEAGGACGAASWSQVAQKVRVAEADWDIARGLLLSHGLVVEPVTAADAEDAASAWRAGEGLSLADRLCLALGGRKAAMVWTADAAWLGQPGVELVR